MHKQKYPSHVRSIQKLKLAYFGRVLSHSRLAQVYKLCCHSQGIDLDFQQFEVEPRELKAKMLDLKSQSGTHICITVPYKVQAFELCDVLTERARKAGSVNIIRNEQGVFYGDNSDGEGFIRDVKSNHRLSFTDRKLLVLGAGGVLRGMLMELIKQSPKSILICNRSQERLQGIQRDFPFDIISTCTYESIPQEPFDFIINATSASIQGQNLPLNSGIIGQNTHCLECAYKIAEQTLFQKWVLAAGAKSSINGWGMLVEQAVVALDFFSNLSISSTPIVRHYEYQKS
ncbi:MAG: hypothetical protein F6K40_25195 [Okeania sp. SIO3I5]|uniref:shikimate dehydrogenase family protein n=1 Tax=Okeania sp. SIO3I5 TaxID=2607805 RepID=UPI0013B7507A|nr:hypothetical protein [Okeania sp. SIO3I5]NEQ39371.1 hypothetical protein [Okeania sp. SIO3I5]